MPNPFQRSWWVGSDPHEGEYDTNQYAGLSGLVLVIALLLSLSAWCAFILVLVDVARRLTGG